MNKFTTLLQILFKFFLVFLLNFIWIRFLFDSYWISVFISACISMLVLLVLAIFSRKKDVKKRLKNEEIQKSENIFFSMAIEGNAVKEFFSLAKTKHECQKKTDYVIISNKTKTIIYPHCNFEDLTKQKILNIIEKTKKEKSSKIIIPCHSHNMEIANFCKNFEIEIILLDRFEAFENLFKPYDFYPKDSHIQKKDKKATFSEIMEYSFNKKRTKAYLFSALILLFSSIFVPFGLYYCIISSTLVLFAIFSYFSPFNKKFSVKKFEL